MTTTETTMTHEAAVAELAAMAPLGSYYSVTHDCDCFPGKPPQWDWVVHLKTRDDVVHQFNGPNVAKLLRQMRAALS